MQQGEDRRLHVLASKRPAAPVRTAVLYDNPRLRSILCLFGVAQIENGAFREVLCYADAQSAQRLIENKPIKFMSAVRDRQAQLERLRFIPGMNSLVASRAGHFAESGMMRNRQNLSFSFWRSTRFGDEVTDGLNGKQKENRQWQSHQRSEPMSARDTPCAGSMPKQQQPTKP